MKIGQPETGFGAEIGITGETAPDDFLIAEMHPVLVAVEELFQALRLCGEKNGKLLLPARHNEVRKVELSAGKGQIARFSAVNENLRVNLKIGKLQQDAAALPVLGNENLPPIPGVVDAFAVDSGVGTVLPVDALSTPRLPPFVESRPDARHFEITGVIGGRRLHGGSGWPELPESVETDAFARRGDSAFRVVETPQLFFVEGGAAFQFFGDCRFHCDVAEEGVARLPPVTDCESDRCGPFRNFIGLIEVLPSAAAGFPDAPGRVADAFPFCRQEMKREPGVFPAFFVPDHIFKTHFQLDRQVFPVLVECKRGARLAFAGNRHGIPVNGGVLALPMKTLAGRIMEKIVSVMRTGIILSNRRTGDTAESDQNDKYFPHCVISSH
ncbi:hypothetical protein [Victivallis vadensis]|uniref:hypothetical protein n=1 Tax=Victivallis vadensis TaxID=172901 RepID=UPI003D04A7EF